MTTTGTQIIKLFTTKKINTKYSNTIQQRIFTETFLRNTIYNKLNGVSAFDNKQVSDFIISHEDS